MWTYTITKLKMKMSRVRLIVKYIAERIVLCNDCGAVVKTRDVCVLLAFQDNFTDLVSTVVKSHFPLMSTSCRSCRGLIAVKRKSTSTF